MPTTHSTVVAVADDGTSPVGTDEWNAALANKYQPTEDVTLIAGSEDVLNTDPYVLDSGRLLNIPSTALLWLDAPRITGGAIGAFNVKDFGAKGDGLTVTDGSITTGTAILTSASGLFSAGDIGKKISVAGAGGAALTAPGAPSAAAAAGTQLAAGTYKYMVTFISAYGETEGGAEASATTSAANLAVALTSIPLGAAGTLKRRIYRTQIGGATGTERLVTEIFDNTTTSFTDHVADLFIAANAVVPTVNVSGASLFTTIAGFTNPNTVTLTDNAVTSISSARVYWGTDDTAAIQKAFYAGGSTYFPPGVYMVSYTKNFRCLDLPANCTIRGSGANESTIRMIGNQPAQTRLITGSAISHVRITDLGLDGNRWNQPLDTTQQCHGIFLDSCSNIRIDNCYIHDMNGDGVQMYALPPLASCESISVVYNRFDLIDRQGVAVVNATNVNVIANRFTNIGYALVDLEPDSDTMVIRNVVIAMNHVVGYFGNSTSGGGITITGRGAVDSENFRRVTVTGNIIDGGGTTAVHGISIEAFTEFSITGNTIRGAAMAGIYCRAGRGTIAGNTMRELGQQGIAIAQFPAGTITPSRLTITGNVIERFGLRAAQHGIILQDVVDSVVSGNVIYDAPAGTFGIYILNTSLRNIVSNNSINNPSAVGGGGAAINEAASGNFNTISNNIVNNYASRILTVGASTRVFGNGEINFIRADGTRTFTSDTNPQTIFNSPANGRITLETGLYRVEGVLYFTAMSATAGNRNINLLGAGTATIGSWLWRGIGEDSAAGTVLASGGTTMITSTSGASIVVATTATALGVEIRGTFEVTVAGTMIPTTTMVTASSSVLAIGSYLQFERLGSTTLVSIGPWD